MTPSSLSRKFLQRVLILLLIGQLFTFGSIYNNRKKIEEGGLNKRAKLLSAIAAQSAARAVLDNYDFTYLSILMDEILKDSDIVSVKFRDEKGKEFTFSGNEKKRRSLATIITPISDRINAVGKIELTYTYDNIRTGLAMHILWLLVGQAAVFLTLIFLIRYFFRRDLGKKISQVGDVIEEVKTGDLTMRIKYSFADEIGVIANGFDFLVENLSSTIRKMRTISQNLGHAADHVNHTLKDIVEKTEKQQRTTTAVFRSVSDATHSQQHIVENTSNLLSLSEVNSEVLNGIKTTFDGIVNRANLLDSGAAGLYSSIEELSSSSKEVASLAEQALLSVREASVTMDGITTSVVEVDRVVKESANLSIRVTDILSGKGMSSVTDTTETMGRIESFFNSLSATITQLDIRSKDIAQILTVIQEVSEKAHLLSLNAQIIAAQSGENGKSFEVVAQEMKSLSAQTVTSAKEIEVIVQTIQKEIKSAVQATTETSRNVQQGMVVVAGTREVVGEILDASRSSTEMMKKITVSTSEQNHLLAVVAKEIHVLRQLNEKVKKATQEEQKSTAYLVNGIGVMCDSMGEMRKETEQQAEALNTIAGNLDAANRVTGEIASASVEQQGVNREVTAAMDIALQIGNETVAAVPDVSASIRGVYLALERLQKEMMVFRTE